NKRVDGKVKTKTLAYLGKNRKDAEKKMEEFLKKDKKEIIESREFEPTKISIEELAAFCKRKGFVFRSSDIYGGFAGFWDYGPLGVELFKNIKENWWNFFVHQKTNMVGIDASIISHPRTWKASGHIDNFSDVFVVCKKCKKASKIDKNELGKAKCDFCGGDFDEKTAKEFKLMFKTIVGEDSESYLRPETAQGMFMNFKIISESSRMKLPFGIAQIGKCFRNEIAPRDFIFRSREFHIGEFEFFINPEETKCPLLEKKHLHIKLNILDAKTQENEKKDLREITIEEMLKEKKLDEWHAYWLAEQIIWFNSLGLQKIKIREHMKDELSHYSSATFDIDYEYPFGSKEVAGNANRGVYDLNQHIKESGQKLEIFDEESKKSIVPRVIEPTFGMERIFLAVLVNSYFYDEKRQNVILKINPKLSPVKASIFPIVKKPEFEKIAHDVFSDLSKEWKVSYDESGSIGRRYSRNDEIGTPFCITVDDYSLKNKDVTIRDRDTTRQIRVKISSLKDILRKLINQEIKFEKAGKLVK
ncbi:MAG: glycine--tRNA ligase, partial [Nanoarchaeota archaeon]